MQNEQELPRPLSAEEIKFGVTLKISEAIQDRLNKSCKLFGCSYPKFRAEINIKLLLDNYGDVTEDNHTVEIGEASDEAHVEEFSLEIPETKPNRFRRETDQPVPTLVVKDGQPQEQGVVFARKRKAVFHAE